MSKILIVCTGFKSNLFSSIQLADELRDAGHEIIFAAPENTELWIDHRGFDIVKIPHAKCNAFLGYAPRFKFGLRTQKARQMRSDLAVEQVIAEGFGDVLDAVHPDLVLADCEHHSAILQTFAAGIPIGLLSFMYLTPPGDTAPPLKSAIVPGVGYLGTPSAIRARWWAFHFKWKGRLATTAFKYWGADFATVNRALARTLGVDLSSISTTDAFQAPWSYRLPTLYLLPEEVNLPVDLYPGHVFAGPKVQTERLRLNDDADSQHFVKSTASKKVFITFGTVRRPPVAFLQKLSEVARKQPNWRFLIASAEYEKLASMTVPNNIDVVGWAPQLEMLKAADCAIFHGGAGTLNECIVTSTPMLVLPNGLDGKGNAARVTYHGIGKVGKFSDSVERLERNLLQLIEDGSFKSALDDLNQRLNRYKNVADRFVKYLAQDK